MGELSQNESPDRGGSITAIDRLLVGIAGIAVGGIAIYILVAIAGSLFRFEVWDELLIISEAMLLVVFLPMAVLIRQGGFIQVDVLANQMPLGVQRRLDYLSIFFGLVFFGLLTWAAWTAFARALEYGDVHMGNVELPQWIGRGILLVGVFFGFIAQLVMLVRRIRQR